MIYLMIYGIRVFLGKGQCNFFTKGWFWKRLDKDIVGSLPIRYLAKHSFGILRSSIMVLILDFIPLKQILCFSLNVFRKQVPTYHKTLIKAKMDELLTMLDS